MLRPTASIVASLLIVPAVSGKQAPALSNNQHYVLIDAENTRSRILRKINLSKLRERLRDAADSGYSLRFMSSSSRSLNMLLKRAAGTSGNYRLVAESGERGLINELNNATAEGFRVLPETIKALDETSMGTTETTWIAVLAKQSDAPRVRYSMIKGRKDAELALASSSTTERTLVGVVGREGMLGANTVLFFEEIEGAKRDVPESQQLEYRVVATARTSAMQSDLAAAAAEGFRVITAGSYMTAVLARERGATPKPFEYRVLAAQRVATSVQELQAAGAVGFRVVATSQNASEAVFIVERHAGTSERFDYDILGLQEANANKKLVGAEGHGYRIVRLLDDLVLLERQQP
ncbi:MAG TPA: hypothetical protein VD833_00025 [Vicinamibacterales bacterium]|nr:hypothetical protein [Vicinamibacterales bacterium]